MLPAGSVISFSMLLKPTSVSGRQTDRAKYAPRHAPYVKKTSTIISRANSYRLADARTDRPATAFPFTETQQRVLLSKWHPHNNGLSAGEMQVLLDINWSIK